MIDAGAVREILKQYEKHGWIVRRVLLCGEARASLENLFGGTVIIDSPTNAVWFSRASLNGEAWELRRLTGASYALVETFSANADQTVRDRRMSEMEKAVAAKS